MTPNVLTLPLMPLRDLVVLPHTSPSVFVQRPVSVNAIKASREHDGRILLFTQKNADADIRTIDDLYPVGVMAVLQQGLRLPDGTVKALLHIESRVEMREMQIKNGMITATVQTVHDIAPQSATVLEEAINHKQTLISKFTGNFDPDLTGEMQNAGKIADLMMSHLPISVAQKQSVLDVADVTARVKLVGEILSTIVLQQEIQEKTNQDVRSEMDRMQRTHILREQMQSIRKQLAEETEEMSDLDALADRISKAVLSDEARQKAESEMKRLRAIPSSHPEAGTVRTYIEWILDLPWAPSAAGRPTVPEAEAILNAHHYALDDVKERVLEHIAVQSRSESVRGPILCLVGPPGVGKTSLGRSVAEATGREFIRIALGGVSDESEIRGHRRTYLGALPGKIITAMKKCKTSNPLILLDEIDKLTNHRGDPEAALLELLDPEQNKEFADTYLEIKYDFSKAMFMTTANSYQISGPLLDRMEVITLSGYTEEEKLHIGRTHLLPKQMGEMDISPAEVAVPDESLLRIVQDYTHEAGVRNFERQIGSVLRKCVSDIVKQTVQTPVEITPENVTAYLGPKMFDAEMSEGEDHIGMVNGLAYSGAGGSMLRLEAIAMSGKGEIKATGRLGEVMKESVQTAASFVRAVAPELGIDPEIFKNRDIHVHAPAGATPKDGPSAGLALATVIVSALTNNPVRRDVAMTGEVTIRGHALPIGGLKEKLLAALRGGIKTVIIPQQNERDLIKMPKSVLDGLEIIPVSNVREVLKVALTRPLSPLPGQGDGLFSESVCAQQTH